MSGKFSVKTSKLTFTCPEDHFWKKSFLEKNLSTDNSFLTSKEISSWHSYLICFLSVHKKDQGNVCATSFFICELSLFFQRNVFTTSGQKKKGFQLKIFVSILITAFHLCRRTLWRWKNSKNLSSDFELKCFAVWEEVFLHCSQNHIVRLCVCREHLSTFLLRNLLFLFGLRAEDFGTFSEHLWIATVNVLAAFSKLTSTWSEEHFERSVLKDFVNINHAL